MTDDSENPLGLTDDQLFKFLVGVHLLNGVLASKAGYESATLYDQFMLERVSKLIDSWLETVKLQEKQDG